MLVGLEGRGLRGVRSRQGSGRLWRCERGRGAFGELRTGCFDGGSCDKAAGAFAEDDAVWRRGFSGEEEKSL